MKKVCIMLLTAAFVLSVFSASFAASPSDAKEKIMKLEKEIVTLQAKLKVTKSRIQKTRIEKIIAGHKKVIAELSKGAPGAMVAADKSERAEVVKMEAAPVQQKMLTVKGGLAGGAGLIAAEILMPMGPGFLGAEAGYAIGSNFGIIDAGVKAVYSMGNPYVGLEVSYAGYSKDVTNVPGLSGTIKSGVGVGIIGGTMLGPVRIGVGYNTVLGVRADAGYRLYI